MSIMTMNDIIKKLEQNQYDIPVEKLTTVQKYGMIEYAFLNHNHIGEIMGLLLSHATSQNQEQKIKNYHRVRQKAKYKRIISNRRYSKNISNAKR